MHRCIYSSVVVLSYSYYILVWTMAESSLVVLNLNPLKRSFQKSLDFWWCSNCFPPIDSCISTCWVMLTIFLYYISLENEKKYSLQSPIHDDDVLDNQNKLKLIHFVCPKHHILMIGDSRMWVSTTSSFYPESLKKIGEWPIICDHVANRSFFICTFILSKYAATPNTLFIVPMGLTRLSVEWLLQSWT